MREHRRRDRGASRAGRALDGRGLETWDLRVVPSSAAFGRVAGDLTTTTRVLREQLDALGLPAAVADDFATRARRADGPEKVTSPLVRTRLGEPAIGVRAVWQPRAERGVVDVAGDWGAGRPDAT
ncbi:MAG: hypothetical protein Q7T56_04760 [Nocardioidaceae bacterium]|nr:hypothetical protein [Nocardioidaceae bacterium]